MLGLSLGLATVAFSLFDAILLRPLPYADSDRLVRVFTFNRDAPQSLHGASLPDFEDWQRQVQGLSQLAAWVSMQTHLAGRGPARMVRTAFATPQLFDTLAVRTALGAEPGHLMRRHVVEGLLYGLLGGAAGVAVAAAAIPALYALVPVDLPAWLQFRLDRRTIAFAASATVGTGLVIGATSLAWHMCPRLADALRPGDKGGLETDPSSRLRRQLTVVQVALSVALLVGTWLTVRSPLRLGQVDTGIRTDGVLVASVTGDVALNATREETIARHARGFRQMREALETLPGVHAVTAATRIPFLNAAEERPVYELYSRQRDTPATAYRGALRTSNAMPAYFGSLGVPMLDGRDFADTDTLETPPVAIVSRRAGERASCSFRASIPWGSRYGGASIVLRDCTHAIFTKS